MQRLVAGFAILAITILVAACGGGGGSDESKIKDTVATYMKGVAQGDGEEACAQLSGPENRSFFGELSESLPQLRATSCADLITKLSEQLGASEKEALERVEVVNVKVHGEKATAQVKGGTTTAELGKEGDRWVIVGGLSGG